MIPVYLVILAGVVLFLIDGRVVLKNPAVGIKAQKEILSLVIFGMSVFFVCVGVNMMLGESYPDPGDTGKTLMSSTLPAKDVRYVSGKSITKTLADGTGELRSGGTVEYKDSLYNKIRVSGKEVLEFRSDKDLTPGQVRIEKHLVKLKRNMMFKYGIRYVVVLP